MQLFPVAMPPQASSPPAPVATHLVPLDGSVSISKYYNVLFHPSKLHSCHCNVLAHVAMLSHLRCNATQSPVAMQLSLLLQHSHLLLQRSLFPYCHTPRLSPVAMLSSSIAISGSGPSSNDVDNANEETYTSK